MALSRQEIKDELKACSVQVRQKVDELCGDYARDVDFSYVPFFTVLFFNEMRHQPDNPTWPGRDRLIVSNMKVVPSLLAVLAHAGYFTWKEFGGLLVRLPKLLAGSSLAMISYPGVEFVTDEPYHGMIHSLGFALAGAKSRQEYRVYHVLNESRSPVMQEVLLAASQGRLGNLACIIPFLDLQQRSSTLHFWFSMGWQLEEVRFEDTGQVFEGFARSSRAAGKPRILMG